MLRTLAKLTGLGRHSENHEPAPALLPPDWNPSRAVEEASLDFQPMQQAHGKRTRTARLHRVPLNRLGLFGPAWSQRLGLLGIETAAQFIEVSSEQWQQWGMNRAESRKLRRWADAVRLASAMPSMKPYEAMLLFAIHRRRLSRLAGDLPGRLHRDLLRFALSTPGKTLLRSRPVPERQRVERWIEAARSATRAVVDA